MRRARRKVDSWQVVYIDLMTNVMIFFVIFWSLNQGRDQGVDETIGNEATQMVNLPGDVLFKPGQAQVTKEGRDVLTRLFKDDSGAVLTFEESALTKRMLVVHGHTDGDGTKDKNLDLGFQRALATYREIRAHSKELSDHVIICSHADNTPSEDVPVFKGKRTKQQTDLIRQAKARNRRITIEDKVLERLITP